MTRTATGLDGAPACGGSRRVCARPPHDGVPLLPPADVARGPRQPAASRRRDARGDAPVPREHRAQGADRRPQPVPDAATRRRRAGSASPSSHAQRQVLAFLLTRNNDVFQNYYLSGSLQTIKRWSRRFRSLDHRGPGGRPPTDARIVELVVTMKRENPAWGERRLQEELRRMGIKVARATIQKILRDNGFRPFPGRPRPLLFERFRSGAKDALWALDFFAVKTAKGVWLQALLVIDIHTRELLDLRVHDGWDVDSRWTARSLQRDRGAHQAPADRRRARPRHPLHGAVHPADARTGRRRGADAVRTPVAQLLRRVRDRNAAARAAPAHPRRRRRRAAVLPRRVPAVHERRPRAPGHRGAHAAGTVDGRARGGGD